MNRVEIVNLGGRTHQIETEGASAIDAWLGDAARRLQDDPDRDDLLLDFERAIGEKCAAQVRDERDVVTASQVAAILDSLGTIESTGVGELAFAGPAPAVERTRRLFRFPDERMIAGVCSGVAAWLGVDVTVVRVAWALLPVATLGLTGGASVPFFLGLYVLLALVLPRANSPEAKAAARGYGTTAQDVLLQARSGAMPALSALGTLLGSAIRVALRVLKAMLLLGITALVAAWVVGAGWLAVAGEPLITAFGPEVSRWLVPALFACLGVFVVAPLVVGVVLSDYALRASAEGRWPEGHLTSWLLASTAAWVVSVATAVLLVVTIPGIRDVWPDGVGRLTFLGTTYCYYQGADRSHCMPGDTLERTGSDWRYELEPVRPVRPITPVQPVDPFRFPAPVAPVAPDLGSFPVDPMPAGALVDPESSPN